MHKFAQKQVRVQYIGRLTLQRPPSTALSASRQPLDVTRPEFLGPRFEHKFSRMKVHADARDLAANGLVGTGQALPFLDHIQKSFGKAHDLSTVRAYVGEQSAAASGAMGACAYASGEQIAFRVPPNLRIAAPEAVHVVQQRQESPLLGCIGQKGDAWERRADEVAERVANGR